METVLWLVAVYLLVQYAFVLWNLASFPKLGETGLIRAARELPEAADGGSHETRPLVSVLIPARDEERNLADCLASVLANGCARFEVLVLDDRSKDRTAAIAHEAANSDRRVRVLAGLPLPAGWTGKAYACHQLAQEAAGDWWLFLDADARLAPDALERAMANAVTQQRGLITGFPRQVLGSWIERLIVPLMSFTIACHLPVRLVRRSADPKFVAAHGAFLFIHRVSYAASGGHAAHPQELVDDMRLAKETKRAGHPVTLAAIHPYVHMRMYRKGAEVWRGFRKNLFAGIGRSKLLLAALTILYAALYLLPPLTLLAGDPDSVRFGLAAAATVIGMLTKLAVDRANGIAAPLGLLLPVSIALLLMLALDSCRYAVTGRGYEWKGRTYS